jgi:DNA-binding response OmpR family regulator
VNTVPGGNSRIVLIADDEWVVREMLSDKLTRAGYSVLLAHNGREALELARVHRPGIVVLDWVMPEMDGLTACRHLKADPATNAIPIIVLTARGQDSDREAGLAAGADLLLVKPVSLRVLLDHIRRLSGDGEEVYGVRQPNLDRG